MLIKEGTTPSTYYLRGKIENLSKKFDYRLNGRFADSNGIASPDTEKHTPGLVVKM